MVREATVDQGPGFSCSTKARVKLIVVAFEIKTFDARPFLVATIHHHGHMLLIAHGAESRIHLNE